MSLFDLKGKVALITGSSRGIGKAIAERLAEHGARVVISSRKAAPCKEVADAINKARGDGTAIDILGGLRGSQFIGAYCMSKAADFQMARNLALEYGPFNVRVNCIAPGLIKTDFARALWEDPGRLELTEAATPLRRIGMPDEIAGAAVFLASKASSYMTGQTIVIDGGVTS